jgi:hypothetical protein
LAARLGDSVADLPPAASEFSGTTLRFTRNLHRVDKHGVGAVEAMRRFFEHLKPGGRLVMPFMLSWRWSREWAPFQQQADNGKVVTDWRMESEGTNPEDGAVVRRWSRSAFDFVNQLEDIEDRYEVIRSGEVVDTEHQVRSPATRWYTQRQVLELYTAAGFSEVRLVQGFTDSPATEADTIFSAVGQRP